MFAGVTYSYFVVNARGRDRAVPDLPLVLGAGGGAGRPSGRHGAVRARAALLRPVADPRQPLPARAQLSRSGDATPTAPDRADTRAPVEPRAKSRRASHLPYARHVDDHTIETRDGLLMQVHPAARLAVRDRRHRRDQLPQGAARRDAARRSASSRFAVYHHVVRREVDAELGRRLPDDLLAPARRRLARAAGDAQALRQRHVPDPGAPAAAGPRRASPTACASCSARRRGRGARAVAHELRQLDTARDALMAQLGSYGAAAARRVRDQGGAVLRAARIPVGAVQCARCARCCCRCRTSAPICPTAASASAQETVELGAGGTCRAQLSSAWCRSRIIPRQTAPGMLDELLRLPFELVLSRRSFGFVDRQAALGADEPRAAADALGRGRGGEPARRAGRAPRTRSPPAAPGSASIT